MSFSELLAIELPLGLIILVFILFEIKQMLADFVLQNSWLAGTIGNALHDPCILYAGDCACHQSVPLVAGLCRFRRAFFHRFCQSPYWSCDWVDAGTPKLLVPVRRRPSLSLLDSSGVVAFAHCGVANAQMLCYTLYDKVRGAICNGEFNSKPAFG